MEKTSTVDIIVIVILSVMLIAGIIYWIIEDKGKKDCETKESPLCISGSCPATTDSCGNAPFKVNSDGSLTCKAPITQNSNNVPTINT
jgi:hypothetical protein